MNTKRTLGQFFTTGSVWLKPQIIDFIKSSRARIAYDPFAGNGDLLSSVQSYCDLEAAIGLDIDPELPWQTNDSLLHIPSIEDSIVITNPPYMSNYSASRKGLDQKLQKYFAHSSYSDLYLIALDRMLATGQKIVAIIPETFINSKYQQKNLLHSITILEENPFTDTETPVIVACFDNQPKSPHLIKIYKNSTFINSLGYIESLRLKPHGQLPMEFNDPEGWLALRCVDTTDPAKMIHFDFKENIPYDWDHKIKISSRLLTLIALDIPPDDRATFIERCNLYLNQLRQETSDIILSPFKGNMKNGHRRRRLDFMTCRAIIERIHSSMYSAEPNLILPSASPINFERIDHANQQILL